MVTNRRAFLLGIGAALAAPAVIRTVGLLMPVKPVLDVEPWLIHWGPITATEVEARHAAMFADIDAVQQRIYASMYVDIFRHIETPKREWFTLADDNRENA